MNNLNIDNNLKEKEYNKNGNDNNSFIEIEFTEKDIIENINKDINYTMFGLTYNKNNI